MRKGKCVDPDQGVKGGPRLGFRVGNAQPESKKMRLSMILFSMISTTLMGVFIVAALTMGHDTLQPILIAAGIGFVLAIPVSWFVARQIEG